MTDKKIAEDLKQNEISVEALADMVLEAARSIVEVLSKRNNIASEVSEMLELARLVWQSDKTLAKALYSKVFFGMRLYTKLGLKNYFNAYDVSFEYNAKKDKLWVFGNPEDIPETYLTFKQKQKLERIEKTQDDKTEEVFNRVIKNLDKEHIKELVKQLNEELHKSI